METQKALQILQQAVECGDKQLNLKIEWAATIAPMLRQVLDGLGTEIVDTVYVVSLKRKDGTTPKACKIAKCEFFLEKSDAQALCRFTNDTLRDQAEEVGFREQIGHPYEVREAELRIKNG